VKTSGRGSLSALAGSVDHLCFRVCDRKRGWCAAMRMLSKCIVESSDASSCALKGDEKVSSDERHEYESRSDIGYHTRSYFGI
jgi:hypothetical protein